MIQYQATIPIRTTRTITAPEPDRLLWRLVLAYAFLIPYQIEISGEMRVAPADAFLLLIGLLGVGRLRFVRPAWTFWHFALVGAFFVSAWHSLMLDGSLTRYALVNKCIGICFLLFGYTAITSLASSWERLAAMLRLFAFSVAIQNVFAIAAFVFTMTTGASVPMWNFGDKRLCGMLGDANGYGGMLVATLALVEITAAAGYPLLHGLVRYAATATLGLGILLTFSRSTWISLGLVFLWSCVFQRRLAIRIGVVAVTAAFLTLLLFGAQFIEYAAPMAQRPEQVAERFELVHGALEAFHDSPVIGIGLGQFMEKHGGVIVHNTTLWFLAEFGLLGVSAFLGLAAWYFLTGYKTSGLAPRYAEPLVMAAWAGHVCMMGLSVGIEAFYKRDWWLIMSTLAASAAIVAQSAPAAAARVSAAVATPIRLWRPESIR